jgi:hypothetical protein
MNILTYRLFDTEDWSQDLEGKFLQLTWKGQEYMLFAQRGVHRYHNQVLAHFAESHAIPHRWITPEQLVTDDPELLIGGGGRFRLDPARHTLEVWDNSQAYGRFNENGLMEKLIAAGPPWDSLRLTIA